MPVPMKPLKKYFQRGFLVADIKAEILRFVGPPTVVIFRYLTETHLEAFSACIDRPICNTVKTWSVCLVQAAVSAAES